MNLPAVSEPHRYAGMYVFDFGEHVAVGYLAEEIAHLLESEAHAGGTAYRIHRVDGQGRFELAGVTRADLAGESVVLFGSPDSAASEGDFAELRRLAKSIPPPCAVQLALIDLPGDGPAHAVRLAYPHHAEGALGGWLVAIGFAGGETVVGGAEAIRMAAEGVSPPVATCILAGATSDTPRSRDEVLRTTREPLQR